MILKETKKISSIFRMDYLGSQAKGWIQNSRKSQPDSDMKRNHSGSMTLISWQYNSRDLHLQFPSSNLARDQYIWISSFPIQLLWGASQAMATLIKQIALQVNTYKPQ